MITEVTNQMNVVFPSYVDDSYDIGKLGYKIRDLEENTEPVRLKIDEYFDNKKGKEYVFIKDI